MRLRVDIIDGSSSLRRHRIAVRAETAAIRALPSTFKHAYQVRTYSHTSDWLDDLRGSGQFDRCLVFLHASHGEPGWTDVVDHFGLSVVPTLEGNCAVLVSYSGALTPPPNPLYSSEFDQPVESWWAYELAVTRVEEAEDWADAVRVGDGATPCVEKYLRHILAQAPDAPEGQRVEASSTEPIRHQVVNAAAALLSLLEQSLESGRAIDLTTHAEEFVERVGAVSSELTGVGRRIALDLLDRFDTGDLARLGEDELETLVLDLERLVAHATRLRRRESEVEEGTRYEGLVDGGRVIWLDDDPSWFPVLQPLFDEAGLDVQTVSTPEGCSHLLEVAKATTVDAILLDLDLPGWEAAVHRPTPGGSGAEAFPIGVGLIGPLRELRGAPPVLVFSAIDSPRVIAECVRRGAAQFVPKASVNVHSLVGSLIKHVQGSQAARTVVPTPKNPLIVMAGTGDPLARVLTEIDSIAQTMLGGPVVLVGEPGVGKELLAEELHLRSMRSEHPFEPVNCAAIPETLAESALFGHAKGAFTGAEKARPGHLEAAGKGVIFLDEIHRLPLTVQGKLLRTIESRTFTRLGEEQTRQLDALVVMASNVDPAEVREEETFDDALVSRFQFILRVPPLRQRTSALPQLVQSLLRRILRETGLPSRTLTPGATTELERFTGSGGFDKTNIRGLLNALYRVVVLNPAATEVGASALGAVLEGQSPGATTDYPPLEHAAKAIVDHIQTLEKPVVLGEVEWQVRGRVITELRSRMPRAGLYETFGWSASTGRSRLRDLRDRGLISDDV